MVPAKVLAMCIIHYGISISALYTLFQPPAAVSAGAVPLPEMET
jgi:hypothetical protein